MADTYRYRCGECGYKTPWGTEYTGSGSIVVHYQQRHPGLPAGGMVEVNSGAAVAAGKVTSGCATGCLVVVGLLILLAALASIH
ncbi:hypothetical protein GXW82_02495 [Streptacidiphilus sp. 4-A2]|nr:hypothetical protein [Streptacidiphilus sp. 4-A2]